ncbi:MAG: DUF3563 family protein [Rhodoferax sp.]
MSRFFELIKALVAPIKSQEQLDGAYLAQASDIRDLEVRMRDIEVRHHSASRAQS